MGTFHLHGRNKKERKNRDRNRNRNSLQCYIRKVYHNMDKAIKREAIRRDKVMGSWGEGQSGHGEETDEGMARQGQGRRQRNMEEEMALRWQGQRSEHGKDSVGIRALQ